MNPVEALEWLTSQVNDLQAMRPGCSDKNCSSCKRQVVEDKHTAEALKVLDSLIKREANLKKALDTWAEDWASAQKA